MTNRLILLILVFTAKGFSQDVNVFFDKADTFFKTYVSNGKVAYAKLYDNPGALQEVLNIAEGVSVSKDDSETYQAFWINAYNLSVIQGVVDHYPIQSPLDVKGFFDMATYNLAEQHITLNDIENKLLREQFNDPRVHFVLVCGAVGCPPLISGAYWPETLGTQMDKQTRLALNGDFVVVNDKKKRIEVSQIMEWYKTDFIKSDANEVGFINHYRTQKIPQNYKLSYIPYNWRLNQK